MVWFFPTLRSICSLFLVSFGGIFFFGCKRPALNPKHPVVVVEAAPLNLNPIFSSDAVSQKMGALLHGALLSLGPNNELVPELAKHFKQQNYTRFEFTLKEDIRFHDGTKITAKDVVQSFQRYLDPKVNSPHAVAFKAIKQIKALGDQKVFIETHQPQPYLLYDLPLLKIFKEDAGKKIIGAGRFFLQSINANQATLVRYVGYHEQNGTGTANALTFKFITDDTTRYQTIAQGSASLMINALGFTKTDHLKKNFKDQLLIRDFPGTTYSYMLFNFRNKTLANLSVRQAIAHAINIEAIINYKLNGYAKPALGLLHPSINGYEKNVQSYKYLPAAAAELLDKAGYVINKATGYRFKLRYKCSSEKVAMDTARMIQSDLGAIGIEVVLEPAELGTYFSDLKNGNYDIAVPRWVGINNASIYFRAFHSSQIAGGLNRGAYQNKALDHLMDLASTQANDQKRATLVSQIQKQVAKDLPYVSLWHWSNTFIGPKTSQDLVFYPNASYMTFAHLRLE